MKSQPTPEKLTAALVARWSSPDSAQCEALGLALWQDLLDVPVQALVPKAAVEEAVRAFLLESATRAFWQELPRHRAVDNLNRMRATGLTLGEVVGPEAAALMREGARKPSRPNRELMDLLLDQPMLRQALKSLVQKSFHQFLSTLGPMASGAAGAASAARGSVLGAIGRGLASKAQTAAQIGKTFVEGLGGTVLKQLEDQVQPFLSGFMSRSVQTFSEALFDGEQAQELAAETRVRVLDTLLKTPLHKLMPEPEEAEIDHHLRVVESIAVHLHTLDGYNERLLELVGLLMEDRGNRSVRQSLEHMGLDVIPNPRFLQAFGEAVYATLVRPQAEAFLLAELKAVWPTP